MNINNELKKAQELKKAGLFAEAELVYNKILAKDSNNFQANMDLSIIFALKNKIKESSLILEKLIKLYPNKIEPYLNYTNILIFNKQYKEALRNLLICYDLDKKNETTINNLVFVYFQIKEYKKSEKIGKIGLNINKKKLFYF